MTTYEAVAQHLGKTIISVYEKDGDVIIQFNDNSHMVLKEQGCNTCSGYRVKGTEEE